MKDKYLNNPAGLSKSDTIKDALIRADCLSKPNGKMYSGTMIDKKDLRRIVLLVREYRNLQSKNADLLIITLKIENKELKSINESLKISLTEQERIVSELIDELLVLRGGRC